MKWFEFKDAALSTLHMSHDMAHVHFGLATFLVVTAVLRKAPDPLRIAWCLLFTVTLANEVLDAVDWLMWTNSVNLQESLKDTINTMLWPSVLWAIAVRVRGNRVS